MKYTFLLVLIASASCAWADDVDFTSLHRGWDSALDHTAMFYVRDQSEWSTLWRRHNAHQNPVPAAPDVDFASSFVVAFFAGPRGSSGYEATIERISEHAGKLSLEVEEKYPGNGCFVLTIMTSPFHYVTIPRRDGNWAFDFRLVRRARPCT